MTEPQWVKDAALLVVVADWFDAYDKENGIDDDKSTQADLRRISANIAWANQ